MASSSTSSKAFASLSMVALLAGCATHGVRWERDANYSSVLDDFRHWYPEFESPETRVRLRHGVIDLDTPAGATLWLAREIEGPVKIEFEATAVDAGGRNDQVSDLNLFWMARNADGTTPVFRKQRGGAFAEYNDLLTYYVGLGGNRNTTTRFRRYIGNPEIRPLLPEHDLSAPDTLLVPNKKQKITLVADGRHIEYLRDGKTLFNYVDEAPYTRGWFAVRTTWSHLRIGKVRIYRAAPPTPNRKDTLKLVFRPGISG